MKLFEFRIGSSSPNKGFAVLVVIGDAVIDLADDLLDRAVRTATNGLVCDRSEETLDEIEPRPVGRCEMHMPTGPGSQPSFDEDVVVRRGIVHDEMDVQFGSDRP